MEGKQFQLEWVSSYTPDTVRNYYEERRIESGKGFPSIYGEYKKDMGAVEIQGKYAKSPEGSGFVAEALVFMCIDKGALGSGITARGTHRYDDIRHGADLVIETRADQLREPIVSAVDVTINQKDSKAPAKGSFENRNRSEKIGFEYKLERIKSHVDYLATMPDDRAIQLSAWIQQGGLLRERTSLNEENFEDAEKLMSLKYYRNPEHGQDPDKPRFVVGGPQLVISVDSHFVNKVFSTKGDEQKKTVDNLSALLQAEVPLAIGMLKEYVESVAKTSREKGLGTNLFFASYRAACLAWEETFLNDQYQFRVERAVKTCQGDKDLLAQLKYFQNTLQKSFGI